MTVKLSEDFVPYAPFSAVVDVIHRYRERGLPDPLTSTTLEQVGVSPSMTGVVVKALVFLKLIDEGGNKTSAFERLRKANSDEYLQVLAEIIRGAYLNVFSIVDPAQDSKQQIDDAFRKYEPANQRAKMVRLFFGLCQEAEIISKKPSGKSAQITRTTKKDKRKESTPNQTENSNPVKVNITDTIEKIDIAPNQRLLSAIFQQLPFGNKWTAFKRQKWINAMTAAVDLMIEVEDGSIPKETQDTKDCNQ